MIYFLLLIVSGCAASSCPGGWESYNGYCYYFPNSTYGTWYEADSYCVDLGSQLASVHSEDEAKFVNSLTDEWATWTGGYYSNGWHWSDGTAWDYNQWLYDGAGGEGSCAGVVSSGELYELYCDSI